MRSEQKNEVTREMNNSDNGPKLTNREKELLQQYRNLCEENKLTIDILIQRLLAHEKGRE
jgi:hypothetical protein